MAKVGDMVRFLNSVGGGKIVRIENNIAHVEDEDGFETPVLIRELVVVDDARNTSPENSTIKTFVSNTPAPEQNIQKVPAPTPEHIIETPEGDKLNIVLAYEPDNIKELSKTEISTYIVNDSNYYLYFQYSSRSEQSSQWILRYAGIVEPNIQLYLGALNRLELDDMERIQVQIIAFKKGKTFIGKSPVSVEHSLDTTKFFKLHCFKENIYFDRPVIALEIVTNDTPFHHKTFDKKAFESEAIREKKLADRHTHRKPVIKKSVQKNNGAIEIDLHINELLDNTNGLSNADMLNLQIDEFRRVMDSNLKNHGQKIIFIHGKGDGVLRNAILKELNHRYKGHNVQDASFREYGFGATQVTIR